MKSTPSPEEHGDSEPPYVPLNLRFRLPPLCRALMAEDSNQNRIFRFARMAPPWQEEWFTGPEVWYQLVSSGRGPAVVSPLYIEDMEIPPPPTLTGAFYLHPSEQAKEGCVWRREVRHFLSDSDRQRAREHVVERECTEEQRKEYNDARDELLRIDPRFDESNCPLALSLVQEFGGAILPEGVGSIYGFTSWLPHNGCCMTPYSDRPLEDRPGRGERSGRRLFRFGDYDPQLHGWYLGDADDDDDDDDVAPVWHTSMDGDDRLLDV